MNEPKKNKKYFKPKAHILRLLGDELIKSSVMAIYELVKNSYDADATSVEVIFYNVETKDKAFIVVKDNGIGMTEDIVSDVWLEPGTDHRKPIDADGRRIIKKSAIYSRVPMGEKGIGRFAVHKLGEKISLRTRPALIKYKNGKIEKIEPENYELQLDLDWSKFSQAKYLEDLEIKWIIEENSAKFYNKESYGTFIQISSVKEEWTKGMARQLKQSIVTMLSPKNNDQAFKIRLDFGNKWLADFPKISEILDQAPYKMTALIDENYELTFEYEFELTNNEEIGKREVGIETPNRRNIKAEIRKLIKTKLEEKEYDEESLKGRLEEFDKNKCSFGGLMMEMYSYDLDPISLKDSTSDSETIRRVLKDHSGVLVFKNDLRVYDYGEPGNDWLGLDLKRVQNKEWFSNNQNIGYIYLNSERSVGLVEKTNREGFIHNDIYDQFLTALDFILIQFKTERQKDRNMWLRFNQKAKSDSFESQMTLFKELIEDSDFSEKDRNKLLQEAEAIEKSYESRKETLLLPAGVGMTASIALHEIDKLVPRMEETVETRPINEKVIKGQVFELKEYVGGILALLKKGSGKDIKLAESVHQAVTNYGVKMKLRGISCECVIDENILIKCDNRYLTTMVMNLIDNSIYWLDATYKEFKGIYITATENEKGTTLIIADNGPGFIDSMEDIVKPFYSRKVGGMGLGMYLVDHIMIKYGKLIIRNGGNSINLVPSKYDGAIVELIFMTNKTN